MAQKHVITYILTVFCAHIVGHLTVFSARIVGNLTKILQKSQIPRGSPGGGMIAVGID